MKATGIIRRIDDLGRIDAPPSPRWHLPVDLIDTKRASPGHHWEPGREDMKPSEERQQFLRRLHILLHP